MAMGTYARDRVHALPRKHTMQTPIMPIWIPFGTAATVVVIRTLLAYMAVPEALVVWSLE